MSKKKKTPVKKQDKEKSKLDKELTQTFPASDPPSRTRPGHEREDDKEKEKDQ